jgi:Phage capsid family
LLRYLIDDPELAARTPGEELAVAACRAGRADSTVTINGPLTTHFPLAATRPRPPVRDLLKVATVRDESVSFVQELRADAHGSTADTAYRATPEAHLLPRAVKAALTTLAVDVPVPDDICADPATLARFVDHRVIVRMCTVENDVLLHGSPDGVITGLLAFTDLRRLTGGTDLFDTLMAAAADVEDQGGSCDALVMHPRLYWRLVSLGALSSVDTAGLRITRTRMIAADQVLLGDFRAGVTLLDSGTSTLSLRRAAGTAVVSARMRVGLAVHLPQHFVLLSLPPAAVPAELALAVAAPSDHEVTA